MLKNNPIIYFEFDFDKQHGPALYWKYTDIWEVRMAKYELRLKARELRAQGESVREIAKRVGVAKSTASLWVRDIILSVKQMEELKKRNIKGGELGRLKGALMQKRRRLDLIEKYKREGARDIGDLQGRELFLCGLALYWAEGSKKDGRLTFCNSDPELIRFMFRWLKECFGITNDRIKLRVGINEIHRDREQVVIKYWSNLTNIPLSQFSRTSFKKSVVKKVYANYQNHYGVLDVLILKPGELYYKILGLIQGLYMPT